MSADTKGRRGAGVSACAPAPHAVMATRARGDIETDTDLQALYRKLDFYPTPPWAARAGAELVKFLDPLAKHVSEPACGMGHMSMPLREFFPRVDASDVYPFWKVRTLHDHQMVERDYLGGGTPDVVDWMMTNPPFIYAADFVRQGLLEAKRGVAVLCRLAFLESEERYRLLFRDEHPLSHVAYFVERVPMMLGRWEPKASTATAYAWFFFDKQWPKLRAPELVAIAPGTKARLTKRDDARRFGHATPTPLLEGARV